MIRRYLVFLGLALLAFGPLLLSPYLYDDVTVVENNELLRSFHGLGSVWAGHVDHLREMDGTYRPLFLSFLSIVGRPFEFHPGFFRFISLLLHALIATLIYGIARDRFRFPAGLPWITAIVFLIHPVQVTSIALVWKQSDIWVSLFSIVSLFTYAQISTARSRSFLLTCALFLLAFGFKESAMIIPALWLALEFLLPSEGRPRRISLAVGGLLVSLLYYEFVWKTIPRALVIGGSPGDRWQYFFTQLQVYPLYAKVLLWPAALSVDRSIPLAASPTLFAKLVVIAVFVLLAVAVYFAYRKHRELLTAALLAIVWLAPTSSFQPLALLYDETRLYLFVGFSMLAFSGCLFPLVKDVELSALLKRGLKITLLITFVFASLLQTDRWQSAEKLWTATMEVEPTSARAYYQLGLMAHEQRALDEAEHYYRKAIRHSQGFDDARLNLGIVIGQKGDLEGAMAEFLKLMSAPPHWRGLAHYHLGLGDIYRSHLQAAQQHFREVGRLIPWTGLALKGEAILQTRLGNLKQAHSLWESYLLTEYLTDANREAARRQLRQLAEPPRVR